MNEIATINNDIEYYFSQKQSELDNIVVGMSALLSDGDEKYEAMKNQNWFKRMVFTVIGKNKTTVEDIRKNNEQLNAYCAKALAAFVERQRISEGIIINLGTQINMLYAAHIELKQTLYGIASKLNEKIESVDNYHMLIEEIDRLDRFGKCYTDIYRVLALFDKHMISDSRKIGNLKDLLRKNKILPDKSITIETYLLGVCDTHNDFVGTVYMETVLHHDSLIALMTAVVLEKWNLIPEANRQLMKKQNVVKKILDEFEIDGEVEVSLAIEYEQAVENKHVILNQNASIAKGIAIGVDITVESSSTTTVEHDDLYTSMDDYDTLYTGLDDCDDSVDDYKTTVLAEKIIAIAEKYLKGYKYHYNGDSSINMTMLKDTFTHILYKGEKNFTFFPNMQFPKSSTEKIVVIIDTSIVKKCREGLVFTTEGFYLSGLTSPIYYKYSDVKNIGYKKKESLLSFDKTVIESINNPVFDYTTTSINKDKLAYTLDEIVKLFK
jgi:hypothetical protein